RYQLSLDEFRGLYVSDSHVDSLVHDWRSADNESDFSHLDERAAATRRSNWAALSSDSLWKRLASALNLSAFEMDVILLAFAPQLDLKYEVIYAYLNNDVFRKWPTLDLPWRIFAFDLAEMISLRSYL